MTGRELIIYILSNGLEDTDLFTDGLFPLFKTVDLAAVELNTGSETIICLYTLDEINGLIIDDKLYILQDEKYKELLERGNNAHNK